MCLITTWKEPKKLKEDLTVYKILNRTGNFLISEMMGFRYEFDVLYKEVMTMSNKFEARYDYEAEMGFYNKYGMSDDGMVKEGKAWAVTRGFHSFESVHRVSDLYNNIIYTCIIPKGSLYYKDLSGLIVSNQIIIKKQMNE